MLSIIAVIHPVSLCFRLTSRLISSNHSFYDHQGFKGPDVTLPRITPTPSQVEYTPDLGQVI